MARKKKPHVYPKPSNLETLRKVRQSKTVTLKENIFMRPETKLRGYQTVGALNMCLIKNMVLGDDPGLGKTIQALTAFAIAKQQDPSLQMIVFTTKSAKNQWGKEVDKFFTGLSYHVVKSTYKPKGAKRQLTGEAARHAQYEEQQDTDILICGYNPLQREPSKLRTSRRDNLFVVFDEVQMLKNPKSKTHIGAEMFLNEGDLCTYGLTATPIKNRLLEFYYVFRIVVPGLLPRVTEFKDTFCIQELKYIPQKGGKPKMMKEVTGYQNLDLFKEVIEPYFFRRSPEDVGSELPPILSKRIDLEMGQAQKQLYAEAVAGVVHQRKVQQKYFELRDKVEAMENPPTKLLEMYDKLQLMHEDILAGDFLRKNKTTALAYCQLVANGCKWLGPDEEGGSAKEDAFSDMFDGEFDGQKVIVYTRFSSGIPRLKAILEAKGIKSVEVTGSVSDKQRTIAMDTFQDKTSDIQVIFITDAGSAAINLQTSGILLFFDSPWTWGDLVQIIGRSRRVGSEHSFIRVYHFVIPSTIDERVLSVLSSKKQLVVDAIGEQAKGALVFDGEMVPALEGLTSDMSETDILFREVFG